MKKQLLTFALLATVAVGGAFAGNAKKSGLLIPQAGPLGNPTSSCTEEVDCNLTDPFPCTINGLQYGQNDDDTGKCSIPLFQPEEQ